MSAFGDLLAEKGRLIADGATGTNLFAMGLTAGDAPESWLTDHPDRVMALHEGFLQAGADLILTNSFGGNAYRLKLHGLEDEAFALNRRAAQLARDAAAKIDRPVLVAGSMGPTGELLAPLGALSREDCVTAFATQAEGLKAGGADLLWIETLSAIEELECAVEAAKASGLPVCVTMSFDTAGRTMMGLTPAAFAKLADRLQLDAFGANCGTGAADLLLAIGEMAAAQTGSGPGSETGTGSEPGARSGLGSATPIIAKANCGIPQFIDGEIVYSGTTELMGHYARLAVDAGATIVGGCCGTTAQHVRAMGAALDGYERRAVPSLDAITAGVGAPIQASAHGQAGDKPARRSRRRGR